MKLNHKAVLTAVIVQQILGFIWYHPTVFGRLWQSGMIEPVARNAGNLPFVAAVFCSISFCYLLSWMFQIAVIEDWQRGLTLGLMVGVGFLAPNISMHYMFQGLDSVMTLVDAGYDIVAAGLAGIILAVFRADRSTETEEEGVGA
jgi:hypothetical protein